VRTARLQATDSLREFAADVRHYFTLKPRQLPSRYFYDDLGSTLFEAICRLPWYPIARAETRLLKAHGGTILSRAAPLTSLVELGSGSGEKLATLLEGHRGGITPLHVHLIDVSAAALDAAERLLGDSGFPVTAHEASYENGLEALRRAPRPRGKLLALFLGSNLGNFDPPGSAEILRRIRAALLPGDAFLLGADLVKPERQMLLAYDDPLGVTAAFNRNLIVRINRELGGDFDLAAFDHRASWNSGASRMEMHLISRRRQRIQIARSGLEVTLEDGEPIWTESSYKFEPSGILKILEQAGFRRLAQWIDREEPFALTLVEAL
jgi:L-histidine N-alpha-methyltransferase